jgi:hypothetical protein
MRRRAFKAFLLISRTTDVCDHVSPQVHAVDSSLLGLVPLWAIVDTTAREGKVRIA